MQIEFIDGTNLKESVIAGARRVIQMQDDLNRINVFPVADNDTGTNMALTMQSIAEGVISCQDSSLTAISQCVAESALMGARGNSGAILAQFFQGLAESFNGKLHATCHHLAEAVEQARRCSYEAISEPKEGTILTVIHDWSEKIKLHCHKSQDILELLKEGLHAAQKSLLETPKKLKLLSKAGVVDAGAQGFVHMLEGITHFLESGKIERMVGISDKHVMRAKVDNAPEDITFQFCTECLVEGQAIDRNKLKRQIRALGNSLIVAGSDQKVRIHIHTNEPNEVFQIAHTFGQVSRTKFEDMRKQHSKAYGDSQTSKIAIVTDSACDLTPEFIIRHNIQMVPLQVSFGNQNFIDKINITPREFYRLLQTSEHHPKTSQPSPGDFLKTYKEVLGQYEQAISIHLSGVLSGTLQAAETAVAAVNNGDIRVLNSRNASVALGLVVAEAAQAVEEGCDLDEIVRRAQWAIDHVRFYICVSTMDYLIRSGRVGKARGFLAKGLNLLPILTIDPKGRGVVVAKSRGGKAVMNKVMELVCKEATGKKQLKFAVAHANAPETADWFVEQIQRQFEAREVMIVNVSPVLGAHAGPGAAGVAFLGK